MSTTVAPPESQAGRVWTRFRRHRLALAGAFVVALLMASALFAPAFAPQDPTLLDTALPEFERTLIRVALKRTQGHRQEAAKLQPIGSTYPFVAAITYFTRALCEARAEEASSAASAVRFTSR